LGRSYNRCLANPEHSDILWNALALLDTELQDRMGAANIGRAAKSGCAGSTSLTAVLSVGHADNATPGKAPIASIQATSPATSKTTRFLPAAQGKGDLDR
jgi:hypothetical protein